MSGLDASSDPGLPPRPWLRGYERTISGQPLPYHSSYPNVWQALLVRATDGEMAIEWETEAVPEAIDASSVTFVWLCGVATGKGAHRFTLLADGDRLLEFRTGRDDRERVWQIPGLPGVRLRFQTAMVDTFGELFGLMHLTLPRSRLRPGHPIRLRVVGEAGGSQDWFLLFTCPLQEWTRVDPESACVRRAGGARRLVRVEISHLGPPEPVIVSAGPDRREARLDPGHNVLHAEVPEDSEEEDLEVSVRIGSRPAVLHTVRLRPTPYRKIVLLPHSHLDIGYSDPQDVVERKHWAYFEVAIDLARQTEEYPAGARFKWNVEQLWAVETYLRQTTAEKRQAFVQAVRNGWIGLQGLLANVLTGLCHPEELYHLTDFARRFAREHGIPIRTAMITDIPSFTWSLVPALVQSGVTGLSSGPNYQPRLPDGGDRIGSVLRTRGDRPFWWISPSGRERLLLWTAGRGYSWFHGLNLGSLRPEARAALLAYARELDMEGYPYDLVQVRYTIGGDNGPPDPGLSDFVRAWNEEFVSPCLQIATSEELFGEFEARHGHELPSVAGDFTPYWEDGAASTARETARNRESGERLLQAEVLWAMSGPDRYPAEEFAEAWRQVVLFHEHTWGSWDSVSDPDGENARVQWAYKQAIGEEADRRSRDLLTRSLPRSRTDAVVGVYNTCGWTRSEVALVPADLSATGDRVEDESGAAIPSQRLSNGELAVRIERIAPFGTRRLRLRDGRPYLQGEARADSWSLENEFLAAVLDPGLGFISRLFSKSLSVDFVNGAGGGGLNEYLYVPGRDPRCAERVSGLTLIGRERGPLVASLGFEIQAPGLHSLRCELRLRSGSDRLEIINRLDKRPVREKESVHFAFPFRVEGGILRLDLGWAWIRPEQDQIAGACRDFFCLHSLADISSGVHGVTWSSLDAPLVEIGELTDETPIHDGVRAWKAVLEPSQTIYSYAMNNYWHTNYRAEQAGPVQLRYAVRPHGAFSAAAAVRFGMEVARPLLFAPGSDRNPPPEPPLHVDGDGVVTTSLRPSADRRAWMVRVYNPGEREEVVVFGRPGGGAASVRLSNPFEDAGARLIGPLTVPPRDSLTLRIER